MPFWRLGLDLITVEIKIKKNFNLTSFLPILEYSLVQLYVCLFLLPTFTIKLSLLIISIYSIVVLLTSCGGKFLKRVTLLFFKKKLTQKFSKLIQSLIFKVKLYRQLSIYKFCDLFLKSILSFLPLIGLVILTLGLSILDFNKYMYYLLGFIFINATRVCEFMSLNN